MNEETVQADTNSQPETPVGGGEPLQNVSRSASAARQRRGRRRAATDPERLRQNDDNRSPDLSGQPGGMPALPLTDEAVASTEPAQALPPSMTSVQSRRTAGHTRRGRKRVADAAVDAAPSPSAITRFVAHSEQGGKAASYRDERGGVAAPLPEMWPQDGAQTRVAGVGRRQRGRGRGDGGVVVQRPTLDGSGKAAATFAEGLAETRPTGPGVPPTLEALLARQNSLLETMAAQQLASLQALQHSLAILERRIGGGEAAPHFTSLPRVAIFVDVPNVMYAAERLGVSINFGKLRELLSRDRDLVRASAYAPISDDPQARLETQRFVQPFLAQGYRIVTKPLRRFADGSMKANFDIELAIDVLTMSDRLDIVCLVSGDGDFRRLVELVQSKGVRVEVVAFAASTSSELRALADNYVDLTLHLNQLAAR